MKYIKLFENFDLEISGNPVKDLNWIKKLIDNISSVGQYKCNFEIGTDGQDQYLCYKDDTHQVHIYDNHHDNDFFLVRVLRNGEVIQDFKFSEGSDISPDEIASEEVLMFISRYFKK